MTNAETGVIKVLNALADRRFSLEVEKQNENQKFKQAEVDLRARHEKALAELQAEIDVIDAELWRELEDNRSSLIQRGKKSFVTMAAKFQLRDPSVKTKVSDKDSVLKVARRLGVIRQIADPPKGGWRLSQAKFLKWLDRNGEYRGFFDDYLEDVSGDESLTIQPNANYTVQHDSGRISPPPVKIEKKES